MLQKYLYKIGSLWLLLICVVGLIYAQNPTNSNQAELTAANLSIEEIQISLPDNYVKVAGGGIVDPSYLNYPNLLLKVVDSRAKKLGQKADTLGVIYLNVGDLGADSVFTQILPDDSGKTIYIAVVMKWATTLTNRIYQLNLLETSPKPLILDKKDYGKWQHEIPILGNFLANPNKSNQCKISDFRANRKKIDIIDFLVKFEAAKDSVCSDFTTQFILQNKTWTGETLDTENYRQNLVKGTLELRKTRIVLSNKFNPLLFQIYAREKKKIFPNWVFYLTRSHPDHFDKDKTPGEVVWVTYIHTIRSLTTNEEVLGSVEVNPAKETAYIALISDGFTTPKLEIYETKIDKSIAFFPLELDQENYVNWTAAGKPLAEKELRLGISCRVESIDLETVEEKLVVTINRNGKRCESTKFFYDLSSGSWSDK
jgi:hypothetical protein